MNLDFLLYMILYFYLFIYFCSQSYVNVSWKLDNRAVHDSYDF